MLTGAYTILTNETNLKTLKAIYLVKKSEEGALCDDAVFNRIRFVQVYQSFAKLVKQNHANGKHFTFSRST